PRPPAPEGEPMALLEAQHLHLAYDRREIVRDLSLSLPEERITIIVGANGSGKSTLLRGMSRLLTPTGGGVVLDGRDMRSLRGKELARRLGLLPQSSIAPDGVTVRELVSRGRFPHQGLIPQWTEQDEQAVAEALAATRTDTLQERLLEELSGGQRQRVWIAMALAQQTEVLLLDEPTTYLDVTHQLEVLDVVRDLNRERGTTVGIVLHDLNLAARYADHLVAARAGEIHSQGAPAAVITERMAHEVFALDAHIAPAPVTGSPMVLPRGRDRTAASTPTHHHEEDPVSVTTETPPTELVPALEHSSMLAFDLTVPPRRALRPPLLRRTVARAGLQPRPLRPGAPGRDAGPRHPRRLVPPLAADRPGRPRLDAHLHGARAPGRRTPRQPHRPAGDRHRRGAPPGPRPAARPGRRRALGRRRARGRHHLDARPHPAPGRPRLRRHRVPPRHRPERAPGGRRDRGACRRLHPRGAARLHQRARPARGARGGRCPGAAQPLRGAGDLAAARGTAPRRAARRRGAARDERERRPGVPRRRGRRTGIDPR